MSLHDIPATPTLSQGQEIEQRINELRSISIPFIPEPDIDTQFGLLFEQLQADFTHLNSAKVDAEELHDELQRKHESLQWAMSQIQQVVADDTAKMNKIRTIVDDLQLHAYERCSKIRELLG